MSRLPARSDIHAHHHAVQFYGNERSLFTTVAGFLSQGLVDGDPVILIATESHRAGILEHLKGRFIDVDRAQSLGDLLVLDARETLSLFMIGDMPDPDAFTLAIGRLITDMLSGRSARTLVRAYGEMVDVLWKEGREDAAIRLEMLWNKLAQTHGFALLCGYAMGSFYKETKRFEEICREHSHVVPAENEPQPAAPKRRVQ